MRHSIPIFLATRFAAAAHAATAPLENLELKHMTTGYGAAQGKPLTIGGVVFQNGVGAHAPGEAIIELDGKGTRFNAKVGIDSLDNPHGTVEFIVYGDGKKLWSSGICRNGDAAKSCEVDLKGVR